VLRLDLYLGTGFILGSDEDWYDGSTAGHARSDPGRVRARRGPGRS
jgi:hypothetical protein